MDFYKNFVDLCKQRGVSPSAVAKEIGLNNSSVTYWKKGSEPKTSTIEKLADYFNVSPTYFLGLEQRLEENLPDVKERQDVSGEIWDLYKNFSDLGLSERLHSAYRNLSRHAQEKVVNYAEDMCQIEKYHKK